MTVENVSKIYEMGEVEVVAVKKANLEIYEGEFMVILGASGSGKSTLLNILWGMDIPTEGKVHMGNFKMRELSKIIEIEDGDDYWRINKF